MFTNPLHIFKINLFSLQLVNCLLNILFCLIFNFYTKLFSQSIILNNPDHIYTKKDGLISDNIYGAIQDHNGFIWFYGDNGISKFDGFHFRNFTVNDGLPSQDIWFVIIDSENRLWLHSHSNKLSYIKNDKINTVYVSNHFIYCLNILYNQKDTIIFNARPEKLAVIFNNDSVKVIPFSNIDLNPFSLIIKNKYLKCNSNNFEDIQNMFDKKMPVHNYFKNGYSIKANDCIYSLSSYYDNLAIFDCELNTYNNRRISKNNIYYWPEQINNRVFIPSSNSLIIYNNCKFSKEYFFNTKINVNRSIEDIEGNIWLCTSNSGIFFYNNKRIRYLSNKISFQDIVSKAKVISNSLFLEFQNGELYNYNFNLNKLKFLFNSRGLVDIGPWINQRFIAKGNYEPIIYNLQGAKVKLHNYLSNKKINGNFSIPNKICKISEDSLVFSNHANECFLLVENEKGININLFHKDSFRVDNLVLNRDNELLICSRNKITKFTKSGKYIEEIIPKYNDTILNVSCIVLDQWHYKIILGTFGQGILFLQNNFVWKLIEGSQGLEILSLFTIRNYLIANTNKGIISFKYEQGKFSFDNIFSDNLGIIPEQVKCCFNYNDSIAIISKSRIDLINPEVIDSNKYKISSYDYYIDEIKFDYSSNGIYLPNQNSNLKIKFAFLNYSESDDVIFRYKLGKSSQWINLTTNVLELSQIASGKYFLDVEVIRKNNSEILAKYNIPITIEPPWYKNVWILIAINILFFGCMFQIYKIRLKRNLLVQEKINKLEHNIREARLQALEGQMNPHFIFNSLISIQYYIQEKKLDLAEYYLMQFSKLIRSYLEVVRKSTISLENEIGLLRKYIELEHMRFDRRFAYDIDISSKLKLDEIEIPTMLIQPFVENAIRHGLFHRLINGELNIIVYNLNRNIHIQVIDNGIGIKNSQSIEYSSQKDTISRALQIFKEKIELFNSIYEYKIQYSINELNPSETIYKGTKVEIIIQNIYKVN